MNAETKRKYNSSRRKAQAQETRKQIIDAAKDQFSTHGYSGATIDSIAEQASVSSETIYAVFGNKRNILSAWIDISIGGDDQPIPLMQRGGPQAVLHETDPERVVGLFAEDIAGIVERVAPVFEIMRMAAKREPEIAALLKELLNERVKNLSMLSTHLQSLGALRPGLNETLATDSIWVISSPEVYSLLTQDRGWTKESYVDWLRQSLARYLLN